MEQNIVESAKIISRFASEHAHPYNETGDFVSYNGIDAEEEYWSYDKMKYHTSWDWLKPVIDKIHKLNTNGDEEFKNQKQAIDGMRIIVDIEHAWAYVVSFLNYYNETIKTKP